MEFANGGDLEVQYFVTLETHRKEEEEFDLCA